jgi:dTDP-L-rhamnose 4-epimerase
VVTVSGGRGVLLSPEAEMRVLVSGDAGLLDGSVAAALQEAGHETSLLDPGQSIRANSADAVVLHARPASADIIFEGALAAVERTEHNLVTVLRSLHDANFAGPVVVASTAAVYGETALLCVEHGGVLQERSARDLIRGIYDLHCPYCGSVLGPLPARETAPTRPFQPGAATSLHLEHLCNSYAHEHPGTTVTALRFHGIYGPGMAAGLEQGVIGACLARIDAGEPPMVFEDGGQLRDPIHVADAARAVALAVTADPPYDGPLNVGGGRAVTVLELATMLCVASESAAWPHLSSGYRPGDVRHLVTDQSKVRDVLGFRPAIALREGLTATWRDHSRELSVAG